MRAQRDLLRRLAADRRARRHPAGRWNLPGALMSSLGLVDHSTGWSEHSGGAAHDGPEWGSSDEQLATEYVASLSPRAVAFLFVSSPALPERVRCRRALWCPRGQRGSRSGRGVVDVQPDQGLWSPLSVLLVEGRPDHLRHEAGDRLGLPRGSRPLSPRLAPRFDRCLHSSDTTGSDERNGSWRRQRSQRCRSVEQDGDIQQNADGSG